METGVWESAAPMMKGRKLAVGGPTEPVSSWCTQGSQTLGSVLPETPQVALRPQCTQVGGARTFQVQRPGLDVGPTAHHSPSLKSEALAWKWVTGLEVTLSWTKKDSATPLELWQCSSTREKAMSLLPVEVVRGVSERTSTRKGAE